MDGGTLSVARALPIDAALVGDVLVRLRRDTCGTTMRWTLGERGSAELDVDFFPVFFGFVSNRVGPAWTTSARLWDPEAVAVASAVVELTAVSTDTCELAIRPDVPLTPWWEAHCRHSSPWPTPRSTSSPRSCSGRPPATASRPATPTDRIRRRSSPNRPTTAAVLQYSAARMIPGRDGNTAPLVGSASVRWSSEPPSGCPPCA